MTNPSEFLDDSTFAKVRNNLNVFCFVLLSIWFLEIPYSDIGLLGFKPFSNVEPFRIEILLGAVFVYLCLRYYQDLKIETFNLTQNTTPRDERSHYLFDEFKDTYSNFFFYHISRKLLSDNIIESEITSKYDGADYSMKYYEMPKIQLVNVFRSSKRENEGFFFGKKQKTDKNVLQRVHGNVRRDLGTKSDMLIKEGFDHYIRYIYPDHKTKFVFLKANQDRMITIAHVIGHLIFIVLRPQVAKLYLPVILSVTLIATRIFDWLF